MALPPQQPGVPQPMQPQQQQKKGTGFTNLQSYLKASNPMAGQQIAGKIGQDVTQRQEKVTGAMGEASKVGEAIKAQQQKVSSGTTPLTQQIQNVASGTGNAEELQNKASDINYYTEGGYSKEAEEKRKQFEQSGLATASAIGGVSERAGQLASEAGRYSLLQDVYRRPTYGAGLQRLDQAYLQNAGGDLLQGLQQGTAQNVAASQQSLKAAQDAAQSNLANILTEGKKGSEAISGALTSGLSGMEEAQRQELEQKQSQMNTGYDTLTTKLQEAAKASAQGKDIEIDQATADLYKQMTGQDITQGAAFNLFNDENRIKNLFQKADLQAKDVVTSDELKRMQTLAGLGKLQGKYSEAGGDTQKNLLSSSLQAEQEKALQDFMKEAESQQFSASGLSQFYDKDWKGSKTWHDATATASANLKDVLSGMGYNIGTGGGQGSSAVPGEVGAALALTGQNYLTPALQAGETTAGRMAIGGLGAGSTELLGNALTSAGLIKRGQSSGQKWDENIGIAESKARSSLRSQIEQYLKDKGFGRRLMVKQ